MANNDSFEKFYFEKVALGEGCGCAEQVISTRELDKRRRAAEHDRHVQGGAGGRSTWLGRLLAGKRAGKAEPVGDAGHGGGTD